MCSLGDFMQRPSRVATGSWTAPASLPGRALVRYQSSLNSRGGDFCWPPAGTSVGHKRGLSLATTGYFEVATARITRAWLAWLLAGRPEKPADFRKRPLLRQN